MLSAKPPASQLHGRSRVCLVLFLKIPIAVNGAVSLNGLRRPFNSAAVSFVNTITKKVRISRNAKILRVTKKVKNTQTHYKVNNIIFNLIVHILRKVNYFLTVHIFLFVHRRPRGNFDPENICGAV